MPRTVLTYGGLDLNNGTSYFLLPGADPGPSGLDIAWDEYIGADGTVRQYNVRPTGTFEMAFPLRLQGTSEGDLQDKLDAINTKIAAGPQTLVYGPYGDTTSYTCGYCRKVTMVRTQDARNAFTAFVDFRPVRTA